MLGATSIYAQKFGRINSQEIIMSMPETEEMRTNLETFGKELEENIETINVEFNNKFQEYQKTANTLSDSVREMKAKELEDRSAAARSSSSVPSRITPRSSRSCSSPLSRRPVPPSRRCRPQAATSSYSDVSAGSLAYFDEAALTDLAPEVRKGAGHLRDGCRRNGCCPAAATK